MFVWFLLMVILALIEIFTVSLTSIWFAIGALGAMITSLFSSSVTLQLLVFIIVSTLLLISIRPIMIKKINLKKEKTNLDNVINKIGSVIELKDDYNARIEVDGLTWKAKSYNKLYLNHQVKIMKIEGVTLIVEDKG